MVKMTRLPMVPVWISGFLTNSSSSVVYAVSAPEALSQPVAQYAVAVTTFRLSPLDLSSAVTVAVHTPDAGIGCSSVQVIVSPLTLMLAEEPSEPAEAAIFW